MPHGITWLSFLPGYFQAEAFLRHYSQGILGNPLLLQHVVAGLLVALVVVWVAFKTRKGLDAAENGGLIPDGKVSLFAMVEAAMAGLHGQMRDIVGPKSDRYFPVIGSLALFIFFSNILGLVPGFAPPTDNWNTTFACGIFVFLYYNFHGLRVHGMGHIKHLANPMGAWWGWFLAPLMFPIELVSHMGRPFSLGVRLAANMMGDHAVVFAFLGLVPIVVPLPFLILGLLVCVVQTVVFILLSMIYIGLAVADSHDHDDAADHAVEPAMAPAH